jgi:hypothetical protein
VRKHTMITCVQIQERSISQMTQASILVVEDEHIVAKTLRPV